MTPACSPAASRLACRYLIVILACVFLAGWQTAPGQVVVLTPAENNLYNTGYTGTTLSTTREADSHYALLGYGTGLSYQSSPLANGWVANPSSSQWITINSHNNLGPSISYTYQLTLTNIPAGELVTISGSVAADDNATIAANSQSPVFSNYSSHVVGSHYNSFTAFSGLTFVSGATNVIDIVVDNNGGSATGLNLQLSGSYTALTSTTGIQFTPPGPLTQNQTSVAQTINRINQTGTSNPGFVDLTVALLGTSAFDFGAAMDQLSPERLGVLSSIAFNDASFLSQNLDDYLAGRRNIKGNFQVSPDRIDTSGLTINDGSMDPMLNQIRGRLLAWDPPASNGLLSDSAQLLTLAEGDSIQGDRVDGWNMFVSGDVILGQNFSQPELAHSDYTTSSGQVGADYQFGKHVIVGGFFNYGHTDTTLDNEGSSATIDSYTPGIFASYANGGWYGNALFTYSRNAYTTERHITIGGFEETANGAPEGDQELGDLDGGYEFHSGPWTFGPTAGVQYTHLDVQPFTESGAPGVDLHVNNETADSLRSRFGGRVSYVAVDRGDGVIFTPFLDASWQHEWLAGSRQIVSSFNDVGGGDFIVTTPDTTRDSALLVIGLKADISTRVMLFTNYAVQVGESDYFGQSVEVGARFAF